MIVTQGGRFGGYGFYLLKGKPVFLWNLVDLKRPRWEGTTALSILASDRIVNGPNDALQHYKLGILSREINKFKYFST